MMTVVRPLLSTKIASAESRTEAFGQQNFGARVGGAAVELHLPASMNANQLLAAEVLLDLCLRMDPVICEVRIVSLHPGIGALVADAARRFPLQQSVRVDPALVVVRFAIGGSDGPYLDVNDWLVGFNTPVSPTEHRQPAAPFVGALEAAKYIFLSAATVAYPGAKNHLSWSAPRVFDVWSWQWSLLAASTAPRELRAAATPTTIALVGCGGVGAGYLWFLRKTSFVGELLLIDDDIIKWHNMNRLPYANISDADLGRAKIAAAADYMSAGWSVRPLLWKAEHDEAHLALEATAAKGGLLASAVGEPETRKYLGRRGFSHFFDAGTNSDGWARALALTTGVSKCSECQIQARATTNDGRCAEAETDVFSGVAPHLALYGGALMAVEHCRVLFGAPVLGGSNTQSIMLDLDPKNRMPSTRCAACPLVGR